MLLKEHSRLNTDIIAKTIGNNVTGFKKITEHSVIIEKKFITSILVMFELYRML